MELGEGPHTKDKKMVISPYHLKVLTWNIDGLDERCINQRGCAVCIIINLHSPDVVMLQEVLEEHLVIFQQLDKYELFPYQINAYFNLIMLKKDINIVRTRFDAEIFKNSKMGRALLKCEILFHNLPVLLMTAHLESLQKYSIIRQEQMRLCFETISKYPQSTFVVFAGDLNIREHELKNIGPLSAEDAWDSAGMNVSKKFTWDMLLNDNKTFQGNYPRTRYDRMYYRNSSEIQAKVSCFELVGTEKDNCGLFPSDHFGILVTFQLTK